MKHILLYSGWQICNIGDIGHTPGTLRYLEQFIPEAQVTVALSTTTPDVSAMLARRFPGVRFLAPPIEGEPEAAERLAAFDQADLILQNSGMKYNRFFPSDLGLMRHCQETGKRFGIYGQSFDGFAPDLEGECIRLLSLAEFVYCRESLSLNYLRGVNVAPPVLAFGPDGCFGIDVRDDARAEAYLAAHDLRDFLSVTIRTNSPLLIPRPNRPLNPSVVTEEQKQENEHWAAGLREVIIGWVRTTGKKVLLAPEVDKEIAWARTLLWERLPDDVRTSVVCRDEFWNVDEAASIYARASALVAMEPHSCIIGLANGVPSIHYYSLKHGVKAHMFADIGLPEWLHDINTVPPARVLTELLEIYTRPAVATDKVATAMDQVNKLSCQMAQTIRQSLELPPTPLARSKVASV